MSTPCLPPFVQKPAMAPGCNHHLIEVKRHTGPGLRLWLVIMNGAVIERHDTKRSAKQGGLALAYRVWKRDGEISLVHVQTASQSTKNGLMYRAKTYRVGKG